MEISAVSVFIHGCRSDWSAATVKTGLPKAQKKNYNKYDFSIIINPKKVDIIYHPGIFQRHPPSFKQQMKLLF